MNGGDSGTAGARQSVLSRLGSMIPVLAGLGISVWVIQQTGWGEIASGFGRARYDIAIPAAIMYVILSFWTECMGFASLISRTVIRTPLAEVKPVRAVLQLLGFANVWVAQAGLVRYYSKRSQLPMAYVTGVFILYMYIDLVVMTLFAGMLFKPQERSTDLFYAFALTFGVSLLPLLFLARRISEKKIGSLEARSVWFMKSGLRQLFASTFLIPLGDLVSIVGVRLVKYPLRAAFVVILLQAFHVTVGWAPGMVAACFVLLAGSAPLTPQGLGIIQAVALILFAGYGRPGDIAAAMFFASITVFIGIIVMGLVYSRGGMSLLKTEWKA